MVFAIPAWKVVASRFWTPVDCEIVSSSVGRHSGDSGPTYSIDVRYRYRFEGAEFLGDRYEFLGGSSSGYDGKQEVVDALPEGSMTTCYVDPDDPNEAVLYRGFSWVYLFALLPLVFIVVGGVGIGWALFPGRRTAKGAQGGAFGGFAGSSSAGGGAGGAGRQGVGAFREVDSWAIPVPASGPVELEEPLSPLGKLGCLVGVCLFWNGIVSVFVWAIWSDWQSGGGFDGCMTVFLIPFVLVGLALLVGIPYQLLALANPRPRLGLSRAAVPLGGSAQLDWSFRGSTRRLQDLRIWIEGSEKATYRRGTSTHTDTEVFAEIEVVQIERGQALANGSATLEMPAHSMHSFEADHNKVVWTLKLTASIAWWPDVITEFPFVVEPGRGSRR